MNTVLKMIPLRFQKTMFHARSKKVQRDTQETKHFCVENDTKNVNVRLFCPASVALTPVSTQLL